MHFRVKVLIVTERVMMKDDIHEDHDLKATCPDKLAELIGIVHQEHTDSPLFPITLP